MIITCTDILSQNYTQSKGDSLLQQLQYRVNLPTPHSPRDMEIAETRIKFQSGYLEKYTINQIKGLF